MVNLNRNIKIEPTSSSSASSPTSSTNSAFTSTTSASLVSTNLNNRISESFLLNKEIIDLRMSKNFSNNAQQNSTGQGSAAASNNLISSGTSSSSSTTNTNTTNMTGPINQTIKNQPQFYHGGQQHHQQTQHTNNPHPSHPPHSYHQNQHYVNNPQNPNRNQMAQGSGAQQNRPGHSSHHHPHPQVHHPHPQTSASQHRPIQPHPAHHYKDPQLQHQQQQHHHQQQHQQQLQQQQKSSSTDSFIDAIDLHILESIEYPFCSDHSKYENLAKIGQGTFGEVYKAKCKKTNEIVALKKVLTENEKEGFPITALREIKILQVLRHDNIVRLIEICTSKATAANKYKSNFYLVFEFCEHDLAGLLSNPQVKFSLGEQKKIMQQLLNGLYYIHKNYILHRDMKTANILVTKDGKLKLADFGLARAIEQRSDNQAIRYTNRVVTLWYRPPELLLGERCYNRAIDMWGAGCIMAELWTREPILKGNTDQNQLELIQNLCGSITSEVWPEVEKLELYGKIQLRTDFKRRIKDRLSSYIKDTNALDLLDKLLTLDPKKRIDSDEALDHDFFWTDPLPTDLKLERLNASMFEYTAQNFKRNQFNRQQAKPVVNEQHYDRVY